MILKVCIPCVSCWLQFLHTFTVLQTWKCVSLLIIQSCNDVIIPYHIKYDVCFLHNNSFLILKYLSYNKYRFISLIYQRFCCLVFPVLASSIASNLPQYSADTFFFSSRTMCSLAFGEAPAGSNDALVKKSGLSKTFYHLPNPSLRYFRHLLYHSS